MRKLPRVLIVEDEPAIAELISVNLRHNGFQPFWAEDGEAAQRELDAVLPDVILLDWMLPGQSGWTLERTTTSPNRFPPRNCWRASAPCCVAAHRNRPRRACPWGRWLWMLRRTASRSKETP